MLPNLSGLDGQILHDEVDISAHIAESAFPLQFRLRMDAFETVHVHLHGTTATKFSAAKMFKDAALWNPMLSRYFEGIGSAYGIYRKQKKESFPAVVSKLRECVNARGSLANCIFTDPTTITGKQNEAIFEVHKR